MCKFKAASFFCGIGGIDLGFAQTGKVETIWANDSDSYACSTFEHNFQMKPDNRDVKEVNGAVIENVDIVLGGFPCQPFSDMGHRQGLNDYKGRGHLFQEMIRVINEMPNKPRVLFFENVPGLLSNDKGKTFKTILNILEENGYFVTYKTMDTYDYGGVPQNRKRVYIVAFLNLDDFEKFDFPDKILLQKNIEDILEKLTGTEKEYLSKESPVYDRVAPVLKNKYKLASRNRSGVWKECERGCRTLIASMGTGGNNVPLLRDDFGIRRLTIRECLRLQGYPDDFNFPSKLSMTQSYKQIGNSVTVSVVKRIADNIVKALE